MGAMPMAILLQVGTKSDARTGQRPQNVFPPSVRNTGTPKQSTLYVPLPLPSYIYRTASFSPSSQENIPLSFRSIVGISRLLQGLLPRVHVLGSNYRGIQHIVFPPHHQDPPDTIPKCKGFALVTLTDPSAISHLLAHFPYHNSSAPVAAEEEEDDNDDDNVPEELEARKAGFRALSMERWEALQSEYVEYRDALLRHVAASSSISISTSSAAAAACTITTANIRPPTTPAPANGNGAASHHHHHYHHHNSSTSMSTNERQRVTPTTPYDEVAVARAQITRNDYPPGCVIFARHVPADTNKTALRAQFSALLNASTTALDYVDYTKGLDTVRLLFLSSLLSLLRST